jgi:hypothetical protein
VKHYIGRVGVEGLLHLGDHMLIIGYLAFGVSIVMVFGF